VSGGHGGFTLIELLLVVVISLLAMSMAVPLFANASRSNKLRISARAVVTAHRYARGMAVLRQADMVLLLDEARGSIQVVHLEKSSGADTNSVGGTAPEDVGGEATFHLGASTADAGPVPTNSVKAELDRRLPEGVRITAVEGNEMQRHETTFWIDYQPNGMCDPFEVELTNEKGRTLRVRVRGATGSAEVLDE
jgi:prepilin-type N-terminal cleavage/methylation domain-containing protein